MFLILRIFYRLLYELLAIFLGLPRPRLSDCGITGGGSATQPRYRVNGVLDTGQTCLSNVDKIVTAGDSWMQYNAASGKWAIVINKAETASLAFNDSNIIGSINVGAIDITQSINQIQARFNDKTNRDQANYVNESTPTGLLYPNEPVNKYTTEFSLTNNSVQAQYLANRILEQAREDLIDKLAEAKLYGESYFKVLIKMPEEVDPYVPEHRTLEESEYDLQKHCLKYPQC